MVNFTMEELLDFVFDDLPPERESAIKALMEHNKFCQDIVVTLHALKREFQHKAKVKKWLERKQGRIRNNFSKWKDQKSGE